MTGEGDCFLGDAFLEAAVAIDAENVLVENRVLGRVVAGGGALAGQRVTHRISHPLTERTGGRLDARCFMKLRMPRRDRVQGAEIFHIVARHRVAGKMQPTVEEHRAMAGREDEAVAVQPLRRVRVVAHGFAE